MIIMLCGKGGCGKSTVTALLAKELVKQGKRVLVIDSDESNFGLHKQLGAALPPDYYMFWGGKRNVTRTINERGYLYPHDLTFDTLPRDYVSEANGVKLMCVGKIHDADEGCACPIGVLSKEMLDHLIINEDEVVLVDSEAGVEHFGRGVDDRADIILMVADPSYESVQLSSKIYDMAKSINKKYFIVLNKTDDEKEAMMREAIEHSELIAGAVPQNNDVLMAGLKGEQIPDTDASAVMSDILTYITSN